VGRFSIVACLGRILLLPGEGGGGTHVHPGRPENTFFFLFLPSGTFFYPFFFSPYYFFFYYYFVYGVYGLFKKTNNRTLFSMYIIMRRKIENKNVFASDMGFGPSPSP
jgi:hypothetical protein